VYFSGFILTYRSLSFVDQSSPDIFGERGRNCSRSVSFPILDILRRSRDIRDESVRWYKIDRNFACFWPPNFFGGEPAEFLDLRYKIKPDSYRVAKFYGDRPRKLGDLALKKKKKHHEHFISPTVTRYGRPNNN